MTYKILTVQITMDLKSGTKKDRRQRNHIFKEMSTQNYFQGVKKKKKGQTPSPTAILYMKWERNLFRLEDSSIRGKTGSLKMKEMKKMVKIGKNNMFFIFSSLLYL